ncbi:MAG TPA: glutathione S-transferase family protein [Candidatus Polarisedimenticolia bacterium]|nr:glutathione S-transferase family protein [Candidatus Polarisedimenticolia bacterium]
MRLFNFEACPFCEKVRLSLKRMGLDYESVVIDPAERGAVEKVSGQRLVPVLCDGDRVIPDSTRILRYLIARYGERGMLPAGPADQALAWIVEDYADEVLGPLIHAALSQQPAVDEEIEKHLETQFRNLEQLFSERGFALGGALSLADIALYAFLGRLVRHDGKAISAGFPHLKAWYSRMEAL